MRIPVDSRAERLHDTVLRCRSENHIWVRMQELVTKTRRVRGRSIIEEIEIHRVCTTCESERVDLLSVPTFALLKRKYRMTPDYKPKTFDTDPHDKITKQHYRTAYLARELKELLS